MFGIVNFMALVGCGVSLSYLRKSAKIFWQADKAEPDDGWSLLAFTAGEALPNTVIGTILMLVAVWFSMFIGKGVMIGIVPIALLMITFTAVVYKAIKYKNLTAYVMLSLARIMSATLFTSAVLLYTVVSGANFLPLDAAAPNIEQQMRLAPICICLGGATVLFTLITAYQSARHSQKWEAGGGV